MNCYKQVYEEINELAHKSKEYLLLAKECKTTHPALAKSYIDGVSIFISLMEKLHNQIEETKEYEFEEKLYEKKLEEIRFKQMLHTKYV